MACLDPDPDLKYWFSSSSSLLFLPRFNPERSFITTTVLEIDYFTKKNNAPNEEFNSDLMATDFQEGGAENRK